VSYLSNRSQREYLRKVKWNSSPVPFSATGGQVLQREVVDEYENPVIKDLLTFYMLTEVLILNLRMTISLSLCKRLE
jgi:hypothetical protein